MRSRRARPTPELHCSAWLQLRAAQNASTFEPPGIQLASPHPGGRQSGRFFGWQSRSPAPVMLRIILHPGLPVCAATLS